MKAAPPRLLVVETAPEVLAERIDELTVAGKGWINVLPEIPEDVPVPPTPTAFAVFSKRGPLVPLATWTAPTTSGRHPEPAQVGVHHGLGRSAARFLADTPAAIPSTWRTVQDHARRGLVIAVPPDAAPMMVAEWIFTMLSELCIPPRTQCYEMFVYPG